MKKLAIILSMLVLLLALTACGTADNKPYQSPRPENYSFTFTDANNDGYLVEKVGKNYFNRQSALKKDKYYEYNEEKKAYDVYTRNYEEGDEWQAYETLRPLTTDDAVLGDMYAGSFFDTSITRDFGRKPKQTGVSMFDKNNIEVYEYSGEDYYYAPDYDVFFKLTGSGKTLTWEMTSFYPNVTAFTYSVPTK